MIRDEFTECKLYAYSYVSPFIPQNLYIYISTHNHFWYTNGLIKLVARTKNSAHTESNISIRNGYNVDNPLEYAFTN